MSKISGVIILLVSIMFAQQSLAADNGLIRKQSAFSYEQTIARLKDALAERNIGVMHSFDHAAGADTVGLTLRPTKVLIFGNPAVGAKLMQESQSIGLDLPLKALVYVGETDEVFVLYSDINAVAARHHIAADHPVLGRVANALELVTDIATKPTDGAQN